MIQGTAQLAITLQDIMKIMKISKKLSTFIPVLQLMGMLLESARYAVYVLYLIKRYVSMFSVKLCHMQSDI